MSNSAPRPLPLVARLARVHQQRRTEGEQKSTEGDRKRGHAIAFEFAKGK